MSSVKLMEARWRAGHRGEELVQPPTGRQREETDREREEHWKSPAKVFSSSSSSMTHTCTHLARWTHTHTHTPSYSKSTHCGDALSPTDVERRAYSDSRPAREREREKGGGEISIILASSECHR